MPSNLMAEVQPVPGLAAVSPGDAVVRIAGCRLKLGESQGRPIEFKLADFMLGEGDRLALTGPSGCGKSTLLNLVSGLLKPDAGEISVLGQRLNELGRWQMDAFRGRSVGFIYQNLNLLEGFSALENVLIGMRFGRVIRPAEQRKRATELLDRVGLADRLSLKPSRLSMGERQRVAVARALANRPALLLADEPTGALDPTTAGGVFNLIQELCRETGCSLLFVTHDMELAERLPSRFDCRGLVAHQAAHSAGKEGTS